MSCRLPTFRVMTGGIFGNMFVFFEWYCDTTESLKDSFFFFSPFIVYTTYVFVSGAFAFELSGLLMIALFVSQGSGTLVLCHCKPSQVQCFSVALKACVQNGGCGDSLGYSLWKKSLGAFKAPLKSCTWHYLFFSFCGCCQTAPRSVRVHIEYEDLSALKKHVHHSIVFLPIRSLVLCTFLSFQFGLISSGTDRTNSSTGLCVLLSGWSPFLHTTGSPTRI